MLIPWDQIFIAALLASLLALVILIAVKVRWKALTLPYLVGLTLCAGIGLAFWFFIFNTFSLSGLDFDFPIPLFPVSPEDLSCMVVTGLLSCLYRVVARKRAALRSEIPNNNQTGNEQIDRRKPFRLDGWVWIIPALAALIIDVYFI